MGEIEGKFLNHKKEVQNNILKSFGEGIDIEKIFGEGIDIEKARHGIYADNPKNRRLKRVGQEYGNVSKKQETNNTSQETFTSSHNDKLTINGNHITVVNSFGDSYTGVIENGNIVTKNRVGLQYLTRAYNEYTSSKDSKKQTNGNKSISEYAKNTDDETLKKVMENKNAPVELRDAAKKELESRGSDNSDKKELESKESDAKDKKELESKESDAKDKKEENFDPKHLKTVADKIVSEFVNYYEDYDTSEESAKKIKELLKKYPSKVLLKPLMERLSEPDDRGYILDEKEKEATIEGLYELSGGVSYKKELKNIKEAEKRKTNEPIPKNLKKVADDIISDYINYYEDDDTSEESLKKIKEAFKKYSAEELRKPLLKRLSKPDDRGYTLDKEEKEATLEGLYELVGVKR
jgi:NADH:ubiquinone oxidoreductase subunit E